MERVLYVGDVRALGELADVDRVYFGAEFCPELLPRPAELRRALAACRRRGKPLSLMTPWCRDETFARLEELLALLPPRSEVIVNDWGTAALAREKFRRKRFALVFGRLLLRGKRDPREGPVDARRKAYLQTTNETSSEFRTFLRARGFARVELDNAWQGHRRPSGMAPRRSLYYPFVFTSVTAKCLYKPDPAAPRCGRACLEGPLLCTVPGVARPLITRGNAEFYRRDEKPSDALLRAWKIDRLVFTPAPPR